MESYFHIKSIIYIKSTLNESNYIILLRKITKEKEKV